MKAAAERAIKIDDTLAEAHTALGAVKAFYEWDWVGAEADFKRGIELNPNYATGHAWYGLYLEALGRHEESLAERKRASDLDPLNVKLSWALGSAFYHAGQDDKAIEIYQKAIESDPNFFMLHQGLGAVFEQVGRYEEAIAAFKKAAGLPGNMPRSKASLAHAFAAAGLKGEAARIVAELEQTAKHEQISSFDLAIIAAGMRNFDRAFEYLEKAYAEGDPFLKPS